MKKQSIKSDAAILDRLYAVIRQRRDCPSTDSYVSSLFAKGATAMHAKIVEEADELVEASALGDRGHIVHETADLLFHAMVLLGRWHIEPGEIYGELARRWGVSGITEKEGREAKAE